MTTTTAAFDLALARRAYAHLSHHPDERAEQERQDFHAHLIETREWLLPYAPTGPHLLLLGEEMAWYRAGYLRHVNAILAAKSRTASAFVVGPANFPTERNRKRLVTERNRKRETADWVVMARNVIKRKLIALAQSTPPPDPNARTGEEEIVNLPGLRAVRNFDADRLQLFFAGKPDDATRQQLKSSGWHWSPTSGAWQRKITPNAEYALARFLEGRGQQ